VAVRDLGTGVEVGVGADRWFHAASTIKVAVLVALFARLEAEGWSEATRVHVRNQFTSLADGRYYRVPRGRDSNQRVHDHVGRTMRVGDLARHMIVTSSNLATNVVVELLGLAAIQETLEGLGVEGVSFRRGVEDERAWEMGLSNEVTAAGLRELLGRIAEGSAGSPSSSARMLEILHDQEYSDGIPAGLPSEARVANKTGEISTVMHDAGVVFLPERDPYVVVILSEWAGEGSAGPRRGLIATISRLVLEHLTGEAGPGD
jgi:beta-lactamase class A